MTYAAAVKNSDLVQSIDINKLFDKFGTLTAMWCVLTLSIMVIASSGVSLCA
jgi:hypothetical protein